MIAVFLVITTLAALTGMWTISRRLSGPAVRTRFVVPLPAGHSLDTGPGPSLAVSPDGARLVFVALQRGGGTQLFLRNLDEFEATLIPNTQGASAPFFSPDGRWIGFHASGALHRVPLDGGAPLKITDAPAVWSAAWGADQQIVFATAVAPNGLRRMPSDGGTPEELTLPKSENGELQHAFPQFLPGGGRLLFSILTKDGWQPAVLSLETREWQVLRRGAPGYTPARFASSGHLIYAQANGGLVAVPFDPARGELTGSATPLLESIDMRGGGSAFAMSRAPWCICPAAPSFLSAHSSSSIARGAPRRLRALAVRTDIRAFHQMVRGWRLPSNPTPVSISGSSISSAARDNESRAAGSTAFRCGIRTALS